MAYIPNYIAIIFFIFQAQCCLWKASCGLCCFCLPPINESTGTRIMYTLFFVVGFLIACFMLSPNFEQAVMENVRNTFNDFE